MRERPEPIFIAPRLIPRRWGRANLGEWCAGRLRPPAAVGEIFIAHPNNMTSEQRHLGAVLSEAPHTALGALGRAPPSVRLILADEPTDLLSGHAPLSYWRMLEAPLDGIARAENRRTGRSRQLPCRCGDAFRADADAALAFSAGVVALEARAHFSPRNLRASGRVHRLDPLSEQGRRSVWLRDSAMSVEVWTLPEVSTIEPDSETCHVLVALTPGAALDGRPLARGEGVFIPAQSRPAILTGAGAQVLAAYPDLLPTEIWRLGPRPDPAMAAMQPALLKAESVRAIASARGSENLLRAV